MDNETKLTSVNVLNDVYKQFKINSIEDSLNFQKLVNRSLNLYNTDSNFRNQVNNHTDLNSINTKF